MASGMRRPRATVLGWIAGCALLAWSPVALAKDPASAAVTLNEAEAAARAGALEAAAARFEQAAQSYAEHGQMLEASAALLRLGETQQALGRYRDALNTLERALRAAEGDDRHRAAALGAMGNAMLALCSDVRRDGGLPCGPEDARARLEQGLALAREADAPEVAAPILINLGNSLTFSGDLRAGRERYLEAARLARAAAAPRLEAQALANAGRVTQRAGDEEEAKTLLAKALERSRELSDSRDKAYLLVNVGRSYERLAAARPAEQRELLRQAFAALSEAARVTEAIQDDAAASWAWGYLGGLYESRQRFEEALELSRRALAAAQRANASDSLYRWQWQAGRILSAQGQLEPATDAYCQAVETLQSIRSEVSMAYGSAGTSFEEILRPVYYGCVDRLLRVVRKTPDPERQARLRQARDTLELLKADELRDYFRDDCVDALYRKRTSLDVVSPTAVVVYPVILPERLEFVVSIGGQLHQFSTPVEADELTASVRRFRAMLEKRTTHQYLAEARRLYDWLVRPWEPTVSQAGVETLVIIPDGPMRTIPLSALHDGDDFLVARYAVVTTPGLDLTDPRPLDRGALRGLLSGLSEPVQGFTPLDHVARELAAVHDIVPGRVLLDEEFRSERVGEELENRDLSVVHIASHGQFENRVEDTFLLTYDGKLTMDALDQAVGLFRFRDNPLELLTLSACETAAGDDRAALGLAGVAVKAGARSVLATLWTVSDRAAYELVTDFYRQLQDESASKAAALQHAQQKLLADPAFRHPAYWSAFVLIGNWL